VSELWSAQFTLHVCVGVHVCMSACTVLIIFDYFASCQLNNCKFIHRNRKKEGKIKG
jgi:Fe-S-cluster-containing dehydrogenase component